MFSSRIPEDLEPSAFARLKEALGDSLLDLTESNPTRCDIPYPEDLLEPLARPENLRYHPDPQGELGAREAVAEHYRRQGAVVEPGQIFLTASTSEAYACAFKLLGEPGRAVAVPRPSYPLLEHLVRLEGLEPVFYELDAQGAWQPVIPEAMAATRPCALVAVHPNNPTGSYLHEAARRALLAASAELGWALIVDEVFREYPLDAGAPEPTLAGLHAGGLTLVLGGFSKLLGLPGLKLAWIVLSGPDRLVAEARERLAFILDQYLDVSTPVQRAAPELFRRAAPVRAAIHERCRTSLEILRRGCPTEHGWSVLPVEAGWNAVLRGPALGDQEAMHLRWLREHRTALYPGTYFGFPEGHYWVVSLLKDQAVRTFTTVLQRL